MTFIYLCAGAIAAIVIALISGETLDAFTVILGGVVGVLLAQTRALRQRVESLERTRNAAAARTAESAPRAVVPPTAVPTPSYLDATYVPPPRAAAPSPNEPAAATPASATAPAVIARPPVAVAPTSFASAPAAPRPRQTPNDPIETALDAAGSAIRRWFTQGNVPVKVGVLVLFLGVAALLKYAADQGWLRMPIQFRLAGVAAAACGALVFAWRKRASHRSFALSLQGGAIGVLILTVFAAFRLYGLLPGALAFALLVLIVAGAAALALLQDAIALAVLAIAGGFLAPILTSTGDGSHVALFTYYAVLNAAIFGIAWVRPWRALNLLGFAFTFGIGLAWGVTQYRAELFASTEPFLALFFVFYLLLPVLYAARQAPERRDFVDGTLLFGTPLVAFALQVGLVDSARMPLALSALVVAAVYVALATLELRRWGFVLLGQAYAVLALGFATLSVPLALSARSTSCTWALEGAALVWLGLRQKRGLPRWIGYALQLAAAFAFLVAYEDHPLVTTVLNGQFANALLIALAALVTSRLLSKDTPNNDLARGFFVWGWVALWFAFGDEIAQLAPVGERGDLTLVVIAGTALAAAELLRRWYWEECAWPVLAMFPLGLAILCASALRGLYAFDYAPLEGWTLVAWASWFAVALRALWTLRERTTMARAAHAFFLWLVVLALGIEAAHAIRSHLHLGLVWQAFGAPVPAAALFWLVLQRHRAARWPLADAAESSRPGLLAGFAGAIGIGCTLGLFAAGDPAPLPYVPVLNPLELGQLAWLLLLLKWFQQATREDRTVVDPELRRTALAAAPNALAVAAFAVLTSTTLRSVHFLGGVAWGEPLWDSALAQAALSITWTLAGIAAMVLGQRRASRAQWIGGAVLMGVVLAKLALVDRRFLHDLQAIVGVLVVGMLLVAVGYFAPVPPKKALKGVEA